MKEGNHVEHFEFKHQSKNLIHYKKYLWGCDATFWQKAIEFELDSLKKNKTWTITMLPNNNKLMGWKWLFKIKLKVDGSVDKYNARLVMKGYLQVSRIDYNETFSPIVKLTSIRVILAFIAQFDLEVQQLAMKIVFLNGVIQENINMEFPKGLQKGIKLGMICKLNKIFYGLKQSLELCTKGLMIIWCQ